MKKTIYILFIGLFGLLLSCEKDGTQVVMLENPIVPTIVSMPGLTLERNNGTDMLVFTGTPVEVGFQVSAKYFLEADAAGNNFDDPIVILSEIKADTFKISVSDLNGILLKKFPSDAVSSADFRIRAALVVDGGTGAQTFEYNSITSTADVTLYGLPKLVLLNSGIDQKIESALGNGDYTGYVKLDLTMPFTLKNPDTDIVYGGSNSILAVDGAEFVPFSNGWHKLSANINDLTYEFLDFRIGLIGDATPNGWSAPDSKMEYNPATGVWSITLDLVTGFVKFRVNDDWSGSINLGIGDADHPEYTLDNLWNNGSSKDIPITAAGNYTVKLVIGASKYSATITKN